MTPLEYRPLYSSAPEKLHCFEKICMMCEVGSDLSSPMVSIRQVDRLDYIHSVVLLCAGYDIGGTGTTERAIQR